MRAIGSAKGIHSVPGSPRMLSAMETFHRLGQAAPPRLSPFTIRTTSGVGGNAACNSTNPVCRTAFPGNVIPAAQIDPASKALLSFFPEPNLAGSADGNFATSFSSGGSVNQYNARSTMR